MKKVKAEGKSKVKSEGRAGFQFAKGGKTHMFGRQHAGPQDPGVTQHATKGDGGKFAKGGKTHMFGKGTAKPARAGYAGKASN